jgi:hypothetical protein
MDDSRRCSARSSQTGEQCRKASILGGTVCASHGGSAPQVREAANRRLLAAVDPAIDRLLELLDSDDERVALQACRMVLDRAGIVAADDDGPIKLTPEIVAAEIARLEAELELDDDR